LVACSSRVWLAAILVLLSGGFQLGVAFRVILLLTPRQPSSGVISPVALFRRTLFYGPRRPDQPPRTLQRQQRSRPNALAFQRLVLALDLAVRLWMVRGGSDLRHARDVNEFLEVNEQ
jgi:hypothetical protein